jgi:uracil-DNA glycosylase
MSSLSELLESIPRCSSCHLMVENKSRRVPYIPILAKPKAEFVFIGRDPSPNTAHVVGVRGGRSVFMNEIFRICDLIGLPEESYYITDLCKCHWRTSVGTPYPGTEDRATKLDTCVAQACFHRWLVRELEMLSPKLVIAFGEELYQLLRPAITTPSRPPAKLSKSRDKSQMDGEKWYAENGCMALSVGSHSWPLAVLRHPGNSFRLPKTADGDRRMEYHQLATDRTIQILRGYST